MEFTAPRAYGIAGMPRAVADNDTEYSGEWILIRKNFFGLEVKFSSDTDVNVQVDLEQSNDGSDWVTAIDTVGTITDEVTHLLPVAPVVAVYARLKLTGLYSGTTSNSSTTVLTRAKWVEVEA